MRTSLLHRIGLLTAVLMGTLAASPEVPSVRMDAGPDSTLVKSAPSPIPTLALLDPVDIVAGRTIPGCGDFLRARFQAVGKLQPISRGEMEKKLAEYNWPASKACHEFQCGFDAGNVLLAKYVFFGTVTALGGLYAYTFNILYVPTGRIISSEVGDVPRNPQSGGDEPLKARLAAYVSGLDPARFDTSRITSRGLMAVVDLSAATPESRVLTERVDTHIYASRLYDLMSPLELQELLSAMNISPATTEATDSGMMALGTKLNVAYLIQSKVIQTAGGTGLDLTLFDVAGKRRIRDWPSKPTQDFEDILHFENRFFATLTGKSEATTARNMLKHDAPRPRSHWKQSLISVVGISAGAGLATLAFTSNQKANRDHVRAEAAYSVESAKSWQRDTKTQDVRTALFGSLAILSLGATVIVWTF